MLQGPELEKFALDRHPLHRFGTVEELANLAAFLVSDGSGSNLNVNLLANVQGNSGQGNFSALQVTNHGTVTDAALTAHVTEARGGQAIDVVDQAGGTMDVSVEDEAVRVRVNLPG